MTKTTENEAKELAEIEAKELATIEAEMAATAAAMQDNLVNTTSRISNRGKQFTLPDGTVAGPKIGVVILGYVDATALYPGQFDPNNPEPPVCFAKALPGDDLVPDKSVEKPEAERCDECPNNEFGSRGNGKACKNEYLLSVVIPGMMETPAILSISATGRAGFNKSMGCILKAYGHPAKAIITAEFTDAAFPVVKLTGGKPNPDAITHFRMCSDAIEELLKA